MRNIELIICIAFLVICSGCEQCGNEPEMMQFLSEKYNTTNIVKIIEFDNRFIIKEEDGSIMYVRCAYCPVSNILEEQRIFKPEF